MKRYRKQEQQEDIWMEECMVINVWNVDIFREINGKIKISLNWMRILWEKEKNNRKLRWWNKIEWGKNSKMNKPDIKNENKFKIYCMRHISYSSHSILVHSPLSTTFEHVYSPYQIQHLPFHLSNLLQSPLDNHVSKVIMESLMNWILENIFNYIYCNILRICWCFNWLIHWIMTIFITLISTILVNYYTLYLSI